DRARGIRFAGRGLREGGGHARQGLGPGAAVAPFLPGESRRRGPRRRDSEIHDQLRARGGRKEMKWTDSLDIAIALSDKFPDKDPAKINFVDLRNWVVELDGFDDDPKRSGEKILEAIQMAWIEEAE